MTFSMLGQVKVTI